tara:strand:+ start:132 stop:473 length:342 start_codon:yes stop_codon:yes gene_type:complete
MKFIFFLLPFLKPDFYRYETKLSAACTDDEDTCYIEIVNAYEKEDISSKFYGSQIKNKMYDCKMCDSDCTFIVDNDDILWRFKNGDMSYYDNENDSWLIPHLIKKTFKPVTPP